MSDATFLSVVYQHKFQYMLLVIIRQLWCIRALTLLSFFFLHINGQLHVVYLTLFQLDPKCSICTKNTVVYTDLNTAEHRINYFF